MSADVEFGVMLSTFGEQATRESMGRVATAAEGAGFDAVWVGDHVTFPAEIPDEYPFSPSGEAPFGMGDNAYDAFGVLSYLAGITDELRLGTNTCIVPYRHPVDLARQALTLTSLSGGRFDFGVAAGWLRTEFEVLDVPFAERGSRTDEFLGLFGRVVEEGELAFEGPHHSFQETGFHPIPDEAPPIWVGGRSGASIRRVGEFGDGWTIFWDRPDEIRSTRSRITDAWEDYGREGDPEIAVVRPADVGSDADRDADRPLVGPADSVIDDVGAYADAGTTRVLIDFFTRDPDEQVRQVERFGGDVIPSF